MSNYTITHTPKINDEEPYYTLGVLNPGLDTIDQDSGINFAESSLPSVLHFVNGGNDPDTVNEARIALGLSKGASGEAMFI